MNKTKKGLNGSADLLADAFRKTINDAVGPAVDSAVGPVLEAITDFRDESQKRGDSQQVILDRLEKDMHGVKNHLASHQKALNKEQKEARK